MIGSWNKKSCMATKLWPWARPKLRTKFQIWPCFLTTFWTKKSFQKRLQKKRLKIWIWISYFFETETLGHGLSGTVLTLLWNPVVATQSGWACSPIPTMAASHRLKCTMYQIWRNSPLSDYIWPASLVFFVRELVLDGIRLAQTARSTLAPTMVVTDSKK